MRSLLIGAMLVASSAAAGEVDQRAALEALERDDSVLIDVRTEQEYAEGALKGAARIETQNLGERIGSVAPDKNTPIVLYCRSGTRSAAAQNLLQGMGYSQVINAGGYQDLKAALRAR